MSTSTMSSRDEPSRWARFAGRPVEKLSRTVTSCPSSMRAVTRWLPMKPAPPVTRLRMTQARGEYVAEHQMHVFDGSVGSPRRRHQQWLVHQAAKRAPVKPSQANGDGAAGFRRLDGAQHIGRLAAGRNGNQDITRRDEA